MIAFAPRRKLNNLPGLATLGVIPLVEAGEVLRTF